jgi:hypothetical protein
VGVLRLTTRLMGMRESRDVACVAVRGKPSRIKEAEGEEEVCGDKVAREGVFTKSSIPEELSKLCDISVAVEESVSGCWDAGGAIQPRVLSSWRMRRRIMESGTRLPDAIVDSALIPVMMVRGS